MEPSDCGAVQIKADLKEIRRRIAAFQTRKRQELDELNIQEFCSRRDRPADCCRTDSIVVRRSDSRGHIKVSRVVNQWGPQMIGWNRSAPLRTNCIAKCDPVATSSASVDDHGLPEPVEERIHNMESHLRLTPGKPVPKDIYSRLKKLEDRILFLESISPDYFADRSPPLKVLKTESRSAARPFVTESAMNLDDIDVRIKTLRDSLLHHNVASSH